MNGKEYATPSTQREHFGPWRVAPDEGPGIYHFVGKRTTTSGSIVTINDIVEVQEVLIGRKYSFQVAFFGRWAKYHLSEFEGQWRRLRIDFEGGHLR